MAHLKPTSCDQHNPWRPGGGQYGHKWNELTRKAWIEIRALLTKPKLCSITFTDADLQGVSHPQNNALVIASQITTSQFDMFLVDDGAFTNVYLHQPTQLSDGEKHS